MPSKKCEPKLQVAADPTSDRGDPALRPLRPKDPRDERKRTPEGSEGWSLDQHVAHNERTRASPEFKAAARLAQILDAAVNDPVILRSEHHAQFAGLMRELLAESLLHDGLDEMLKPIERLLRSRDTHKGPRRPGRPTAIDTHKQWLSMFNAKRKNNRIATELELCGDVAADWQTLGHKLVTAGAVKNAIFKLKKIEE